MPNPTIRGRFCLLSVMFLCLLSPLYAQQNLQYVPGELIVKYRSGNFKIDKGRLHTTHNVTSTSVFTVIDAELWKVDAEEVASIVATLNSNPAVAYAEPNYLHYPIEGDQNPLSAPDDPRYGDLWGLHNTGQSGGTIDADIDAPEAWNTTTGSGDIIIGVIDSGVDYNHEDLSANMWTNTGEIPGNGLDDDGNGFIDDVHGYDFFDNDGDPMDPDGHGTHVAGTIAAEGDNAIGITGVNWKAKIMALRFLGPEGGATSDAIRAIEYAVQMGAHLTNNSWGGGSYSQSLKDAIDAAANANQLFVAAAGNDTNDNDLNPQYPAGYTSDNIISVASTTRNDLLSSFSNYGAASVDLGAPGSSILSTLPGNNYGSYNGTSMASPHVAGVAALMISQSPQIAYSSLRDKILASVDTIDALKGVTVTGGRLNAAKALASLDATSPDSVTDMTVAGVASNAVALTFTATGDDDSEGTATSYDIRYSLNTITAANFGDATSANISVTPQPAGETELISVSELSFSTTYYFALKVVDENGNSSDISNVVSATTLGAPTLSASPDSLYADLLTGQQSQQTYTLTNTGDGTLDFSFPDFSTVNSSQDDSPMPSSVADWITDVTPSSGTIVAGESQAVTVTFDAAGLAGGRYSESVALSTNDPANSSASMRAVLDVTGSQDIAVAADTLTFGQQFTGAVDSLNLVIENEGTEVLTVSGLTSSSSKFTTSISSATIQPGDSTSVLVFYSSSTVAADLATLTVASDDPDEAIIEVVLSGNTVKPPVISVLPDSMAVNLVTGQSVTQQLTVDNTSGGSDLSWEIEFKPNEVSSNRLQSLDMSGWSNATVTASGEQSSSTNIVGKDGVISSAYPDLRILVLTELGNGPSLITALSETGLLDPDQFDVSEATSSSVTLEDFTPYDVVLTYTNGTYTDPEHVGNLLKQFVDQGGRVVISTYALSTSWAIQGDILLPGYSPFLPSTTQSVSGELDLTSVTNPNHPIFDGIEQNPTYWTNNNYSNPPLNDGGVLLAKDTNGNNVVATNLAGSVIAMAIYPGSSTPHDANTYRLMANAIINANTDFDFLTITPLSGSVEAGQSQTLDVTFNAAGINTGTFDVNVVFKSNDPATPELAVPVHMDVTGSPDLVTDTDTLIYPLTFISDSSTASFKIYNEGFGDLSITDISASDGSFTSSVTTGTVARGDSLSAVITFKPVAAGEITAQLTISSNDAGEPEKQILLVAEGVEPPVITADKSELESYLATDESETRKLVLGNENGGSTLSYAITLQKGSFKELRAVGTQIKQALKAQPPASVPSSDQAAHSIGVPNDNGTTIPGNSRSYITLQALGVSAVGGETSNDVLVSFPLDKPEQYETLANLPNTGFPGAGALDASDANIAYVIIGDLLYQMDIASQKVTQLGDLNTTRSFTGLTYDPFDKVYYGVTSSISNSSLYTVDIENATASLVGQLVGVDGAIALSSSGNGVLYTYDIVTDNLYSVDKTSGTPTLVGSIGFDANFGQGMSYDPLTDVMFMSAFNRDTFQAELRAVDLETGNTMLLGVLGSETSGFENTQIAWMGTGLGLLPDFVSVDPVQGDIEAGNTAELQVTFDATNRAPGLHGAEILIQSNDPASSEVIIPVEMTVRQPAARDMVLFESWNLISLGLEPLDSLTRTLVQPVEDNVSVILGFEEQGLTFDPTLSDDINTLKQMTPDMGYWFRMDRRDTLKMSGYANIMREQPLKQGFNLIGYMPSESDSLGHALQSVMEHVEIVMGFEGEGLAYVPSIPDRFNTLNKLHPGHGYWVKLSAADTLVYPDTTAIEAEQDGQMLLAKRSQLEQLDVTPGRDWMMIWSPDFRLNGEPVAAGTRVSILDGSGTVAGETFVEESGVLHLTSIYRDDPRTEIDEGAEINEQLRLRIGDTFAGKALEYTSDRAILNLEEVATSIDQAPEIPLEFSLEQNYPNPFNPSTTIKYAIPEAADVTLEVYNTLGRKVATLINNKRQQAAFHTMQFDASHLASGLYIYRLRAGSFIETRKMMLIK